jgi:hypothetical protein
MIGSEFGRACALLRRGMSPEVKLCYERAFELLDLYVSDPKWRGKPREVLRFREHLGELYLDDSPHAERCKQFYKVLLSWDPRTQQVRP